MKSSHLRTDGKGNVSSTRVLLLLFQHHQHFVSEMILNCMCCCGFDEPHEFGLLFQGHSNMDIFLDLTNVLLFLSLQVQLQATLRDVGLKPGLRLQASVLIFLELVLLPTTKHFA